MKNKVLGPWTATKAGRTTHAVISGPSTLIIIKSDIKDEHLSLIAAAPELLEALVDVIGWVPSSEAWHTDTPTKSLARARAAIAKAKGETP